MRGYFAVGVEGISKPMNVGAVMRTAHALGASFLFTVGPAYQRRAGKRADTSGADGRLPFYEYETPADMRLPADCVPVAVELLPDSVDLPAFRHPPAAAYILGPERGTVSAAMLALCRHRIRIPAGFCLNVGIAAAIVMYDRIRTMGRFPPRPVRPGGPEAALPDHLYGPPVVRRRRHATHAR